MKRRTAFLVMTCIWLISALHPGLGFGQNPEKLDDIFKNSGPQDFRPSPILPNCFTGALQRVNSANGGLIFLVRGAPEGCTVPLHWHTSAEQISMVSGTATITMDDGKTFTLKEGGYAFLMPKHVHIFSCPAACVHFEESIGPFDVHYITRDGKEISLQEAMKTLPPK